jgi:hypothetical protein
MALKDDAKADKELPEEVVAEIEGVEGAGVDEDGQPAEQRVVVSRRKQQQQEREERLAAIEARAVAAEERAARIEMERAADNARFEEMRRTQEMMFRGQNQGPAPAAQEPIPDQIQKRLKAASAALGKADLDDYHEQMLAVMELKAKQNIPAPQPIPQAPMQKPAWVTAIEFQYPDVLSHPKGVPTVAYVEGLEDGVFGPEKLHRMFQRARRDLGLAQQAAPVQRQAPANNAQRQLYSTPSSSSAPPPRARGAGEGSVKMTTELKNFLRIMEANGVPKAKAMKSWMESYPSEVE